MVDKNWKRRAKSFGRAVKYGGARAFLVKEF